MTTCSVEQTRYLKQKRKEKRMIHFFQILIFVFLIIIWELLSQKHIINSFLYSSPSHMIQTIYQLFLNGNLLHHIGITFMEILISFIISVLFGLIISILLWRFPIFSKIIDPYLTVLNSLPKVALGPLIIIWFGAKIHSIIFMSLLISLFVTIMNIYHGFIHTDHNLITMAKSFGANQWQVFYTIIFPSNIPTIISTLKVNISMNLIGVIMGELLVSKNGLGYLIMYGSQIFNLDLVLSCIFILCIISYFLYLCINKIK